MRTSDFCPVKSGDGAGADSGHKGGRRDRRGLVLSDGDNDGSGGGGAGRKLSAEMPAIEELQRSSTTTAIATRRASGVNTIVSSAADPNSRRETSGGGRGGGGGGGGSSDGGDGRAGSAGSLVIHIQSGDIFSGEGQGTDRSGYGQVRVHDCSSGVATLRNKTAVARGQGASKLAREMDTGVRFVSRPVCRGPAAPVRGVLLS